MRNQQTGDIREGLTDDFNPRLWLFIGGLIMLVGSAYYANHYLTLLGLKTDLIQMGGDVFLKYLFIIVAVERAAAVFVGISRSKYKVDWALRISRLTEVLEKDNPPLAMLQQVYAREHRLVGEMESANLISRIDPVPPNATQNDYLGYLTSTKHIYEFQRAHFNSISNRMIARIVFLAGILFAALGLSIFQDMLPSIDLTTAMQAQTLGLHLNETGILWQTWLLRLSDIVVTGGLLGGGSAGLNAMANKLSEFVTRPG